MGFMYVIRNNKSLCSLLQCEFSAQARLAAAQKQRDFHKEASLT